MYRVSKNNRISLSKCFNTVVKSNVIGGHRNLDSKIHAQISIHLQIHGHDLFNTQLKCIRGNETYMKIKRKRDIYKQEERHL